VKDKIIELNLTSSSAPVAKTNPAHQLLKQIMYGDKNLFCITQQTLTF
tara:strand:+ start:645 stop:788 length:144 start_codon:yes stop_codon:yes gene_type:complete